MKPSASLKGIVSQAIITNVLQGDSDIDLFQISDSDGSARQKFGSNTLPTIDPALVSTSAGNLYSKGSGDDLSFPRADAEQIARSIAVVNGDLDAKDEYDTSIDFDDSRISRTASVYDVFEIGNFHFFVDIDLNDSETLRTTTYSRTVDIRKGYYGNLDSESATDTYIADGIIMDIGDENETADQRIDDGSLAGGFYLSDQLAGLVNAAQQKRLVNANITLRMCSIRDARVLFGPIRIGKMKIDSASHTINVNEESGLIQLNLVKSWDSILNKYGIRAQHADHLAKFSGDNFMRYTDQVQQNFTWKES